MGRVRPRDVSQIRDAVTHVTAIVQYDVQRGDYCAEINGGIALRAERASDLERKTAEELRHGLGLKWRRVLVFERAPAPVFESRALAREGFFASLTVAIARGEVADRDDKELLFRGWPPEALDEDLPVGLVPPDTRIVSVISPMLRGGDLVIRPYSEGVWRAYMLAALAIARAGEALETMKEPNDVRRAFDVRAFLQQLNAPPKPTE